MTPPGPGAGTGVGSPSLPLGDLRFGVTIPGVEIGRFAECSGIAVEYDVEEYAEGGNNTFVHRLRGRIRYPNVVLRRGVTDESALLDWFFEARAAAQRPNVTVSLTDPLGAPVRTFAFAAAYPVRWTGPTATTREGAPATEVLEFAHEGFVRSG